MNKQNSTYYSREPVIHLDLELNEKEQAYIALCNKYRREIVDTGILKNKISKIGVLSMGGPIGYKYTLIRDKLFASKLIIDSKDFTVPPWVFGFINMENHFWPDGIERITFNNPIIIINTSMQENEYEEYEEIYFEHKLFSGFFNGINTKELEVVGLNPYFMSLTKLFNESNVEKVTFVGMNTKHIDSFQGMFVSCLKLKEVHLGDGFTMPREKMGYLSGMFVNCPNLEIVDFGRRMIISSITHIETLCNRHKGIREIWLNRPKDTPKWFNIPNVNLKFYS